MFLQQDTKLLQCTSQPRHVNGRVVLWFVGVRPDKMQLVVSHKRKELQAVQTKNLHWGLKVSHFILIY